MTFDAIMNHRYNIMKQMQQRLIVSIHLIWCVLPVENNQLRTTKSVISYTLITPNSILISSEMKVFL